MDLSKRTLEALDWPVLLAALAERARTPMGKRAARALVPCATASDARTCHAAVAEVRQLEDEGSPIPVGSVGDVGIAATRAAKGEVLDPPTLREAASTLTGLRLLASRLHESADDAPVLYGIALRIDVDPAVADELSAAFDPTGQLSATTYPELGDLRRRIAELHETLRRTLEDLVRGDTLGDVLQDRFVTQRGDRYVLPVKAHAKNWDIGIVHGTSGSGRTVFVEPTQVVALNNQLKLAEGALEEAEHRILAMLSARFGRIAPEVEAGIEAAVEIDLHCAREGLARALGMTRPSVGGDGVVHLVRARHPVLVLRGVAVVANDLDVGPDTPVLVLTGPNTGGKTVALKTIGLCALLVRAGCWVPADEGSRVDFFELVFADIGDTQTVFEGLSSFSGHLVVLREMLAAAAPGRLFLLDELCSGTDPAQGGALARAVLEALLERGPRVVATTHYAQLKGLATVDRRYALSAMEYAGGRPTYRVVHGATGESHALDTALRLGLDDRIVERARGLMGETERAFQDALAGLDVERERAREAVRQAREREEAAVARERALTAREEDLRRRVRDLEQREGARFLERLRSAEKAIAAVVADLQRNPDHRRVGAARATVDALRDLVPQEEEPAVEPPRELAAGDRVRLRSMGQAGDVRSIADGVVTVQIGALTARVKLEDVELLERAEPVATPATSAPKRVKAAKREAVDLGSSVRLGGNTLDLRGFRVEEAFDAVEAFLDRAGRAGYEAVFLLHGHGTGALKDALRKWLPTAMRAGRFAPANADQGGDAFTVVEVT